MSVGKGFSTTVGVLIALTVFPIAAGMVWLFMCAGGVALLGLAPREDPAVKNLPVAQQQAAGEWNAKVAREKERDAAKARAEEIGQINADIRAQRRRLNLDPPAAAIEQPAEEQDEDGPVIEPSPDGLRKLEAERRAADAKAAADVKSNEEKAENLLKAAKPLLDVNPKAGKKRLQELIEKYPDTIAAAAARALLKK